LCESKGVGNCVRVRDRGVVHCSILLGSVEKMIGDSIMVAGQRYEPKTYGLCSSKAFFGWCPSTRRRGRQIERCCTTQRNALLSAARHASYGQNYSGEEDFGHSRVPSEELAVVAYLGSPLRS
jgi:hypothetical protein